MTENELERMISLADEKYIDEAIEQPVALKKSSFYSVIVRVAAALTLIIGTASMLKLTAIGTEVYTADDESGIELHQEESQTQAENEKYTYASSYLDKINGENSSEEYFNINAPYAKYFSSQKEEAFPIHPETESLIYMPNDYTCKIFDLGYGAEASGLKVYCDKAQQPVYAEVLFILGKSNSGFPGFTQSAAITITCDGSSQLEYSLENIEPQDFCGTKLYGFENDNELHAFFVKNGQGYSIVLGNLGYKEAAVFLELLINADISIDNFDLSLGSLTVSE